MTQLRTSREVPLETCFATLFDHWEDGLLIEQVFVRTKAGEVSVLTNCAVIPLAFPFCQAALLFFEGKRPSELPAAARTHVIEDWKRTCLVPFRSGLLVYGLLPTPLCAELDTVFLRVSWTPKESAEKT
jgi:hypothetical protein